MPKTLDRTAARRKIIQSANRYRHTMSGRRWPHFPPKPYSARHIHQAVAVVRAHHLVADKVLIAAGFHTGGRA